MADRHRLTAPSRVVEIVSPAAGTVLALDPDDWSFGRGLAPSTRVMLVVSRVRTELSFCYDGDWVWVDGHAPNCDGQHPPCRQALVRTTALNPAPDDTAQRIQTG
jgi:hypothetical protein